VRLRGADEILDKVDVDMKDDSRPFDDDNNLARTSGSIETTERSHSTDTGLSDANPSGDKNVEDNSRQNIDDDCTPNDDMLVRLLDQSIARALQATNDSKEENKPQNTNAAMVETVAKEIESIEVKTKIQWVNDHCMLDNDGRARCTFYFCRKLFKDRSFLEKHLTKKHSEYLDADLAQCHDSYIEKFWEQLIHRPIPPVVVDCGSKFGLRPCAIRYMGGHYAVDDPEPYLTRLAEEKMKIERLIHEEEIRRREYNYRNSEDRNKQQKHVESKFDEELIHEDKSKVGKGFVDVDDMKDEKVKLSFENVHVLVSTKGKKKKKLL
jgi:hypothetical protein